ncbi:zinc finger, CCHC-type containing protein [Tanacetum coccineum]
MMTSTRIQDLLNKSNNANEDKPLPYEVAKGTSEIAQSKLGPKKEQQHGNDDLLKTIESSYSAQIRWQKKMHFLLTTLKVWYVLTTPMPELLEDDTVEVIRRRAKWENDDYICRGHILNEDASSKNFLNRVERETNKQNKGKKRGFKENNGGSGSNKKPKLECWKCGKTGHFKRDCRSENKKNNVSASGSRKGLRTNPRPRLMQLLGGLIMVPKLMFVKIFAGLRHMNQSPRPKDIIPNSDESQRDDHSNDVPSETLEPHRGFRQKEGIDYFDTYAPVARITTIRLLLALVVIHNLVIHQMDVKTVFLNGDLEEELYMKQPEGFVMPDNEHKVCKLVKSLYGLKQAPKQWHQRLCCQVVFS